MSTKRRGRKAIEYIPPSSEEEQFQGEKAQNMCPLWGDVCLIKVGTEQQQEEEEEGEEEV